MNIQVNKLLFSPEYHIHQKYEIFRIPMNSLFSINLDALSFSLRVTADENGKIKKVSSSK
ncbi:MAG: hypothetical protein AB2L18_11130 [Anaerolineaceae bacterium]